MSTTTQAILTAVFPAGIPPERYKDLSAIQQKAQELANLAGGWTTEEIDRCSLRGISTEDLLNSHPEPTAYKPPAPDEPITGEDIAFLKDKGHTWPEIAVTTGLTQDKARHLYRKWQKKQNADVLYEPGAEEAAAEAKHAEATIRKSRIVEEHQQSASKTLSDTLLKSVQDHPPADSQITNIIKLYAAADSNIVDNEIKQLLDRKFPGHGFTTADIRARRQKAC